ncbi:hypothetical protein AVEN_206774-1 [Araneus ventricosus]|uniref:Uncharacterized protein n=1 Tax=Araneus ventricosus TaxID=182803 RepID=A0A4Y2C6H8_ARAVE|nr:hypothetical protein AVEN_206774-1 [Araneus ventricosus]
MSLTPEEQEIRCVQHWFRNWTQPQRAEFLNLLTEKYSPDTLDLGRNFESLRISSNCPSVFDCQLKQFSLWFDEWSFKGKENLNLKLLEVDRPFVELLYSKINLQNQK